MNCTPAKEKVIRLSELPKGVRAIVQEHAKSDLQLTLMEMGCLPGEPIWVQVVAPLGDPMAIQISGYYLSIRKRDADNILVTVV